MVKTILEGTRTVIHFIPTCDMHNPEIQNIWPWMARSALIDCTTIEQQGYTTGLFATSKGN